ncbi:hypothetical protein MNEG_15247, partial [Monoraphidium neglectum]
MGDTLAKEQRPVHPRNPRSPLRPRDPCLSSPSQPKKGGPSAAVGAGASAAAAAAASYQLSSIRSGHASDQGRRPHMEDAAVAIDDIAASAAARPAAPCWGGAAGGCRPAARCGACGGGAGGAAPDWLGGEGLPAVAAFYA